MASVSDDPISLWLKLGALDKLEQALLDGYGDQLLGKTSRIPQVARFLKQVPMLQAQIEQIHEDTMQGKLDDIRSLIGSRQLAFCRDQQGASPLHKAVLFQQRNMVTFFVENFPGLMHARDHQSRSPLSDTYCNVMMEEGANHQLRCPISDRYRYVYGHTPDFYLEAPGELTVEQLKEGVSTLKSKKSKHRRKKSGENSGEPAGLKVQIREVIAQGNLEALEELVLHGHGDKLLGEISPNPVVQEFLDTVPGYMEQINDVHRAVVRGRLREVQTLMNHKSLSLARDCLGATPIHKAIMHGHQEIAQHLAENFVQCLSAKDLDGRTPLHYASALKDGRKMYNMLLLAGSPTTIVDSKGKTAEYYLQYPDKINMEQIIKRNQLANATYLGNTISRLKTLAPSFQILNAHTNRSEASEETGDDKTAGIASQAEALKKVMMRNKPILPPVILPRLEVTSANIRKWIDEQDLKKLEGAVFEGYGERLARETASSHQEVEQYLRKDVPRMLERIQAIHRAVADDDVSGLENHLDSADYALARDRMGMTPLHRAVVLGRQDAVKLIVDKFPETINARDREGRTALHYAAAASRRSGRSHLYRLLLQNGSDPRIRDNRGKSSEFYKTHQLTMPPEIAQLGPSAKDKARSRSEPPRSRPRKNSFASSQVAEKLNSALQKGDPAEIRELVHEGHGRHLLGRTSWNEEVRQLLKSLPVFLQNVNATHEAIGRGDIAKLKELAALDENYLKTRNEVGCHPIHAAIENRQIEAVRLILEKFPACINLKASHGRNPLHLAALRKDSAIYKLLVESGADPKALDQKGKTAEYYLKSKRGRSKSSASSNPPRERSPSGEKSFPSETTKAETVVVPATEKGALNNSANVKRPHDGAEKKDEGNSKTVPNGDVDAEQNTTADDGNSAEESDSGDPEGKQPHGVPSNSASRNTAVDAGEVAAGDDLAVADDDVTSSVDVSNGEPEPDIQNGNRDVTGDNKPERSDLADGPACAVAGDAEKKRDVPEGCNSAGEGEAKDEKSSTVETKEQENIISKFNVNSEISQGTTGDAEDCSKVLTTPLKDQSISEDEAGSSEPDSKSRPKEGTSELRTVNQLKFDDISQEGTSNESETIQGQVIDNKKNASSSTVPASEPGHGGIPSVNANQAKNEVPATVPKEPIVLTQQENQVENTPFLQNIEHSTVLEPSLGISDSTGDITEEKGSLRNDMEDTSELAQNGTVKTRPDNPSRQNHGKANSASSRRNGIRKSDQVKQLNNKGKVAQLARKSTQILAKTLTSNSATKQGKNEISRLSKSKITPVVELRVNGEVPQTAPNDDDGNAQKSQENESEDARAGNNSPALETKSARIKDETFPSTKNQVHEPNKAHLRSVPEEQPQKQGDYASAGGEGEQPEGNGSDGTNLKQPEKHNDVNCDSHKTVASIDSSKSRSYGTDDNLKSEKAHDESSLKPKQKHGTSSEDTQNLASSHEIYEESVKAENIENRNTLAAVNGKTIEVNDATEEVQAPKLHHSADAAEPQTVINDLSQIQDQGRNEDTTYQNGADQLASSETDPSSKIKERQPGKDVGSSNMQGVSAKTSKDQLEEPPQVQAGTSGPSLKNNDIVEARYPDQVPAGECKAKQAEVRRPRRASSSSADKEKRVQYKGSKLSSSTAMQLDRLNELIELWIKDGDLLRLEHVVIAGQGERLLNKTSEDKQVQEFLSLVPAYMERIRSVHEAVVRGNLPEVRQVLTRKRFALSRDHLGASPLHLAVLHGHTDVLNYIVEKFPETLDGPDNEGRTPLHYAAVVVEAQNYFYILRKAGADDTIKDKMGNIPEFYMKNPKELTIRDLLENYQTTNDDEKSAAADVWKRPPSPPEGTEAGDTQPQQAQQEAPVVSEPRSVPASVPGQDKTIEQKEAPVNESGKRPKVQEQVLPSAPMQDSVEKEVQEKVKAPLQEAPKELRKFPSETLRHEPVKVQDQEALKVPVQASAPVQDPKPAQGEESFIVPVVLPTKPPAKILQAPVQEPPLVPAKLLSQAVQPAKIQTSAEAVGKPRAPAPSTREVLKSAEVRQLAQSMLREGRTVEEGRYLTDAVGDVLSRGLLAVSKQRPEDPVNFLVTWFKEQVPQKPAQVPQKSSQDASAVIKERSISSRSNTNSSSATR
ncbi:unnamed protein product [Ixodes hexagonus]